MNAMIAAIISRKVSKPFKTFQENCRRLIDETISQDKCRLEPAWTESIAVGSKDFVGAIEEATVHRRRFETEHLGSGAWALRESA